MIKRSGLRSGVLQLAASALLVASLSSCFGSRPVTYFNGQIDSAASNGVVIPDQQIQVGDILNITIFSDNADATAIYNQAGSAAGSAGSASITKSLSTGPAASGGSSYLVDNDGNIRMHAIGVLHVAGLTKKDLTEQITQRLNGLQVLTNPYAVIRFNNFKITVLGEVRSPGVYTLPGEKASVLEVLGLAGDITDYGLKDKVMLIRENQSKRTFQTINLLDPAVFNSPNFYLRQNDVLVVQADRRKPTAFDQQSLQYILVGATVVSSIAIIISIFR
jgi:polysaccharide export outer membrane protein